MLLLSKKNHVGTRGSWLLPGGWHTPAPTWRVGCTSVLGTRGAWAPAFGWALLSTHVELRLSAWELATPPACMWRLNTPRPNYPWAPHAAEPKIALDH